MYTLSVVTQEKVIFEKEVTSIIAPGTEGYLGVLTNHAPLITALKPGKLTVKTGDDHEEVFAITGGFLEVSKNRATILADAIEAVEEE
jgi:F-type H+-transporting ATPase subunit epsilon